MNLASGKYWDRAWSLVEGCSPVSEGCLNCWAAAQTYLRSYQKNPKVRARYRGLTPIRNGRPAFHGQIRLMWRDLNKPLKVKKPTVWSIWNDFLNAPAEFIDEAFDVMGACPEHTFLILTKRPELLESKIYDPIPEVPIRHLGPGDHLPNVYWGVTVEHQKYIHRFDDLFQIPGRHFVNIEPCLGFVDLNHAPYGDTLQDLDAVILGGETGPRARPMHPDWARSVRDQFVEAGVPFFFKQWGTWTHISQQWHDRAERYFWPGHPNDMSLKVGKKAAGRLLDGKEWNELPWR